MAISHAQGFDAKDILSKAKAAFHDYYSGVNAENLLLEGLDFDEETLEWRVALSFDAGRSKVRKPFPGSVLTALSEELESVREIRLFVFSDETGELQKIEAG